MITPVRSRGRLWLQLRIPIAMVVGVFSSLTIYPALLLRLRPRFVFRTASASARATAAKGALLILLAALSLLPLGAANAADLSADEIMQRNFVATKVLDSVFDATIELISTDGQERVRKIHGWTKLQPNGIDDARTVRFTSPADINGTMTLTVEHADGDDDIWIYLPALKKVRRLVAANKKDSYVGTDFSYADIIGFRVSDWGHKILREELADGAQCWVIESTPLRPDVAENSGYGKQLSWIRKDSAIEVKGEYLDLAGQPLKSYVASDVQLVEPDRQRYQPMKLEMLNVQTGHRTVITFDNFKADQNVPDETFTPRFMERN